MPRGQPKKDLSGQRFGSLVVRHDVGKDKWGQFFWLCICDCGVEHRATGGKLRRGEVKSCGCQKGAMCAAANIKHGLSGRGRRPPVEYETWQRMIDRCENTNCPNFSDYGGRGIKVSPLWRDDFLAFYAEVGRRPSPKHSIDRIDNEGNYEPGNVRWATHAEQMRNRRCNVNVTYRGETACLMEWSRRLGVKYGKLYYSVVRQGRPTSEVFDELNPRRLAG